MKIGSLFTGTGALDMAVENVTGGRTVWRCDNDPAVARIIDAHWPGETNLGDITKVDWANVEPVDVLTGGFPCTDVSAAGRRAGLIRYGTANRSGLWAQMARAVDVLRPQLVVAENVRGLLSATTDSDPDLLDCDGCLAYSNDAPMRALGAVLGDLAALGYDAAWHGVRASDVGACHQRFRVFVIAWLADADRAGLEMWDGIGGHPRAQFQAAGGSDQDVVTLLKTPTAQLATNGGSQHPDKRRAGGHGPTLADEVEFLLLPTPDVHTGTRGTRDPVRAAAGRAGSTRDSRTDRQVTLNDAVLLPTPTVALATGGQASRSGARKGERLLSGIARDMEVNWGIYEPAIRRWESLTRPAPPPTETGPRGGQRLSAPFVEWMMGLPDGWVTRVGSAIAAHRHPSGGEQNRPYLTRNQQLKILGNGVVIQQAEHAVTHLLDAVAVAE